MEGEVPVIAAAPFLASRDFLIANRADYEGARSGFVWPRMPDFNWALDYFDPMAAGNDRPALWIVEESGQECRLSFAALASRSNQVANWLRAHDVRRGDRLLLMLGNEAALWEVMLAAIKLGVVLIPTTGLLARDDLRDRIARGHVRHVVTGSGNAAKVDALGGDFTRIAVGEPTPAWLDFAHASRFPTTFKPDGRTRATDPLFLYFTSGTTAKPKLVLHTHQSYPIGHLSTMYWIGLRPDDIHLNISSPGWAKHAWSCFFAPWNAGACVFIYNYARFDAKAMLSVLERCRVTTLCAPPTVWRMLIQEDLAPFRGRLAIRELIGAGEPLNPEIIDRVQDAWGITIRDGFGQTETTALVGNSPGQPVRAGSMGRPLPGYDVVLLDADGSLADEGEVSLRLDPRPVGLMDGYSGDPTQATEPAADVFYRTGDIARRDGEGYLWYIGRADDVFKSSDYRISPFKLESVAIEHPAIAEAAVVPSPDPLRLAVPKCFVTLRAGYTATPGLAADIFAHLRQRLAPYERIRRLEFAEIPKTISGKIRRTELRRLEAKRRAANEKGELEFVEDETSSEEQYRAIFNVSVDAINLWGPDLCMIDANPAYFEMYGYSREEVIGKSLPPGLGPEHVDALHALVRRTLAGESCQLDMTASRRNGERFFIEVRTIPVRYRGATHAITVARDITVRMAAEAERARLEEQLRQAQKMEAIGHLAGGIAHDFNNILTGILGYLVLAAEQPEVTGNVKLQRYLDQAQASGLRARDLIQQLLTFARGRRGERSAIALPALVAEANDLIRSAMPSTLQLQTSMDEVPNVVADRVQIEQVLLNLCINARDALNGVGTVDVAVRPFVTVDLVCASCRQRIDGAFVELAVGDTGPGIPPNVLKRIFEPFYSTKAVGKGSGMGLAVVHGIVHEHGGHIIVDTVTGQGTAFRILLPPAEAPASASVLADSAGAEAQAARSRLRGRVLVVDDEPFVAEFMRELLDSWGLEASVAGEPEAALAMLRVNASSYDLVITDQTMPRMSGLQLAEEIGRMSAAPPVVLYTGYADAVDPAKLSTAGVKGLVRKPLEPGELRAVIADYLERDESEG
jgi:acetyl-CoA synthetase